LPAPTFKGVAGELKHRLVTLAPGTLLWTGPAGAEWLAMIAISPGRERREARPGRAGASGAQQLG
jgi:hypothetical protein